MKRHPFNVLPLMFGAGLILLAAWIAFPRGGWFFGLPRWLPPVAAILIGAALMTPLFTSRKNAGRSSDGGDEARPPSEAGKGAAGDPASLDPLPEGKDAGAAGRSPRES